MIAQWFYVIILLVNGQVYAHPIGPYRTEPDCQQARMVNIPEQYTVLHITPCFQVPRIT